jgi:hypothetical protein
MAATVKTIVSGTRNVVINVTGTFSVSDEVDTVILNLTSLLNSVGSPVLSISIQEITWSVNKFDAVVLEFDKTGADETVDIFSGQGYMDYRPYGGKFPSTSAGTNNLLLTTTGGVANGNYSLLIFLMLK